MNAPPVKMNRRHAIFTLASLSVGGLLSHRVAGDELVSTRLVPPERPIGLDYFGLHVMRLAVRQPWYPLGNSLTTWPAVPFGILRPAYVNWHNLQPKPDRWNFSALDHYVNVAEQNGAEVMLPLCSPPQWASARPNEKSPWGPSAPGGAAEPTLLSDWTHYVRTVAERYRGRIRRYEFWNEPNAIGHTPFFTGTVDDAVQLTREAYRVLKSVGAENILVGPAGVGQHKELNWLETYFSKGVKDSLDALSYHFYVPRTTPEAMLDYVSRFRTLTRRHGLGNLPIMNTESGWVIANEDSPTTHLGADETWPVLSQELAAAYVSRALILGWALGLLGYHMFCWDHFSMGLVEPATKKIKAAGLAYGRTVEWLVGTTMTACESNQGVWICTFLTRSGSAFRIVWRQSGHPKPWALPSVWSGNEYETLDGDVSLIKTATLLLGQKPVLIR